MRVDHHNGLTERYKCAARDGCSVGPFKLATYSRGKKVVQEKLKQRGLAIRNGERLPCAVQNLDFGDQSTIVNGTPDDSDGDRPFKTHFTKEKILWLWRRLALYHLQEAA